MPLSRDPAARRRLGALVASALLAGAAGAVVGAGSGGKTQTESAVARALAALSLRQQVGQLLVSSFDGASAPAYLRRRLRAGELSGVILFRDNVPSRGAARALTRTIQRSARGAALVMTDQEGGAIRSLRFAGPIPPQPAQIGPKTAGGLAERTGRQLRAAGVNVNLAPVADLTSGPAMRSRTFRGTPGQVGAKVRAVVRGYARSRVAATAKHFPGLGAARVNTDQAPATVPFDRAALTPFRAAVAAGVPLVMTSHATYPALDGRRIASQSTAITTGLLRKRLRFRGVAITDSIEARAVLSRSGIGAAAERSIAAGADIVLMTGSASWKTVFPRLLREARRSAAFRGRVRSAARRVLSLKRSLGAQSP
jgi:beta-N-acetylhexosaminidase